MVIKNGIKKRFCCHCKIRSAGAEKVRKRAFSSPGDDGNRSYYDFNIIRADGGVGSIME